MRLVLTVLVGVMGCDTEPEVCISDCESSSGDASEPENGDPASQACAEAEDAVASYVEQFQSCESSLDCVHSQWLPRLYRGPGRGTGPDGAGCYGGGLDVNRDADASELQQLYNQHTSICGTCDDPNGCQDGGLGCDLKPYCTVSGQCGSSMFSEDYCGAILAELDVLLEDNQTCMEDDDCASVDVAGTPVSQVCFAAPIRADVDTTSVEGLVALYRQWCPPSDGDGECGYTTRCDAGQCVVEG